jgi:hypothetical protein
MKQGAGRWAGPWLRRQIGGFLALLAGLASAAIVSETTSTLAKNLSQINPHGPNGQAGAFNATLLQICFKD